MEDGEGIDGDKVWFTVRFEGTFEGTPGSTRISMWPTFAATGLISGYKTIADNPPAEFVAGKENEPK
jgi:hypothetical protein